MQVGDRVEVYRNLRTGTWSVRQHGRVVAHLPEVHLFDAKFAVGPAGRDAVRDSGRKNVHAFVRGTFIEPPRRPGLAGVEITYDPYEHETFVTRAANEAVVAADRVHLRADHTVWASGVSRRVRSASPVAGFTPPSDL